MRCQRSRKQLRENPESAEQLLRDVKASLPGGLAPEEREDAAQAIILDILAGDLPPVVPAPCVLRRYTAAARCMTSDRFRFVSLSAPTRDGREFGETLAA